MPLLPRSRPSARSASASRPGCSSRSQPPSITIAGMADAKEIIGPIVLSIVLVIIAHPVRAILERRGWAALGRHHGRDRGRLPHPARPRSAARHGPRAVRQARRRQCRCLQGTGDGAHRLDRARLGLSSSQTEAVTGAVDPSAFFGVALSLAESTLSSLTVVVLVFAYPLFMAADAAYIAPLFARFRDSHASRHRRAGRLRPRRAPVHDRERDLRADRRRARRPHPLGPRASRAPSSGPCWRSSRTSSPTSAS